MSRSPDDDLGRVGSYRLLSMVEERCLLATYVAENEELGRRALVRTHAPSVAASPRLDEELTREARVVAKLHHPGVVTVYEIIRTNDRLAIAFEHPGGSTLAELVTTLSTRGGIAVDEALSVLLSLTRIVAYVHDQGLVHANVSMKTVYVSAERGVILTGFERARESSGERALARTGLDSAYLSPEELMDEQPTTASDVFALGVVAYELLASKRPFAAAEEGGDSKPNAAGQQSSAHRVRTERAAPFDPSRRVPTDVERSVLRALSKPPNLRQANAGELLRDLEGSLGGDAAATRAVTKLATRFGSPAKGQGGSTPHEAAMARPDAPPERKVFDVALRLGGVFLAMLALVVAIEVVERTGRPPPNAAASTSTPGYVRVLAHPWAEIWIDGVATDTTPLARPIQLAAGRHTLVFKHPRASDERRVVDLGSGEVVTVAVDMRVVAPPIDAGIDASP